MTSYMVRVYPGTLAPSMVFIPIKIDETTTAAEIAQRVALQLKLNLSNPSLSEETPNSSSLLAPSDYPFDRYMLWPQQARQTRYSNDKYKFLLRQVDLPPRQEEERCDRVLLENQGFIPKEDQTPQDLCSLPQPSNHALLRVLRKRFEQREIYSWAGPVLVSINPYKNLPIYTPVQQQLHRDRGLLSQAHVFAVADAAFDSMKKSNVSIIVSGESGSGKSFSTQILIQHLMTLARIGNKQSRLTASQPILENFGHAKTRHNHNSSRVGKFVSLEFSTAGRLTGARVEQYLLEISRVIQRHPYERNFHIFYTLIYGLTEPERSRVGLRQAHEYEYLKHSDQSHLAEWDDGRAIIKLQAALESLGLYDPGQERLFQLMAGILAIGNIEIKTRNDQAFVADSEWLPEAARLLGVKAKTLEKVLTEKSSKIGRRNGLGETLTRRLNLTQACDARDGLAKAAYRKVFDYLLLTLNAANEPDKHVDAKNNQIGILDIFGFERVTEGNGFEQFCINYANETLQLYSNEHIFKLERLEHEKEEIPWREISFPNNEAVITLYNKKPDGLFSLLNENMPGQNDKSLLIRFNEKSRDNKSYKRTNSEHQFEINHYAGWVTYDINNFNEKNRDVVASASSNLLRTSNCWLMKQASACSPRAAWRWRRLHRFIQAAAAFRSYKRHHYEEAQSVSLNDSFEFGYDQLSQKLEWANQILSIQSARTRLALLDREPQKEQAPHHVLRSATTSAQYTASLNNLMVTLKASRPYFIRCIRSNDEQRELEFDDILVREQLISSGMEETVRIKQSSYPIRIKHAEFVDTYRALIKRDVKSTREKVTSLLAGLGLSSDPAVKVGKTRVFLRERVRSLLDQRLEECIIGKVKLLQRNVRAWLAKKALANSPECPVRRHRAACIIQATWRMYLVREQYTDTVLAATMIQRWWRAKQHRLNFLSVKRFILRLQSLARGYIAREEYRSVKIKHAHARVANEQKKKEQKRHEAAVKIQSYWKMYVVRKGHRNAHYMAQVIQCAWRAYRARKTAAARPKLSRSDKFSTMKKLEALTPPDTPPPDFIPPPLRSRSSSGKREQSAVNQQQSADVEIDKKKDNSPRWNVPNQVVELKPVKPPVNQSVEPYQVKLVGKNSFRNKSYQKQEDELLPDRKQASRRHKREQEKQHEGRYSGRFDIKPPTQSRSRDPVRLHQQIRHSVHELTKSDYQYQMRDQIHERIELRPDGTRLPITAATPSSATATPGASPAYASKTRDALLQSLNRSHSIRERREVPPPKRERGDRVRVDRSKSLRDHTDGVNPPTQLNTEKKRHRIQRRRSNSVDSNHSIEVRRELRRKERHKRRDIPDWPTDTAPKKVDIVVDVSGEPLSVSKRTRKPTEPTDDEVEKCKKNKTKNPIFNFSARIRRKKKQKKQKEREDHAAAVAAGEEDSNENGGFETEQKGTKITTRKPESLPAKIVLTDASPKNITSLKTFLTERLPRNKDNSSQQNQANHVWDSAVEEFKRTLNNLMTVSPSCEIRLPDLYRHFDEALDKEIEKNPNIEAFNFPKQLYLNGFRKTLEEYITEERGAQRSRTRHIRKRVDNSGHSWTEHRVIQPNHCAVCEKSLWQLTQKHMICTICKALIHKKCADDLDHPNYPKCKPVANENQLFGVHLERLCRDGDHVPDFVSKILHHLELHGTMKEGIYRVPGAKLEVDRLKAKVDMDPHCINIDFVLYNINAVAAAFKDFLRKLPVPLLPYDFYPDILRVMTNHQPGSARDERYTELTRILKELPIHHRHTIEKIFFHLASVARKSEENRMDPQALAIILAPCIIRAPSDKPLLQVAEEIKYTTKAVELLITHQLENIRSKFKSITELEAHETKITRRLSSHRQSRRENHRHRRSRIRDDYLEELKPQSTEDRAEESKMEQQLGMIAVKKTKLLGALSDFDSDKVEADLEYILNNPRETPKKPKPSKENGFSRHEGGRAPIKRVYKNYGYQQQRLTTKSTNL